ncbi:hypothetical protein E2C01_016814 [Portunus trituberculatus]|uniref:Uncharacterized protein n=1 Tax=Portunus trituberculatus TaxID=210409 RepID=A0A5B7DRS8_PORTR|nr:hypothetical protein [Portunus trituberculatus]
MESIVTWCQSAVGEVREAIGGVGRVIRWQPSQPCPGLVDPRVRMEQEELQYEEVVDAGEGGEESFVGAAEDEHHLNDTDQSIETELEAIKVNP